MWTDKANTFDYWKCDNWGELIIYTKYIKFLRNQPNLSKNRQVLEYYLWNYWQVGFWKFLFYHIISRFCDHFWDQNQKYDKRMTPNLDTTCFNPAFYIGLLKGCDLKKWRIKLHSMWCLSWNNKKRCIYLPRERIGL